MQFTDLDVETPPLAIPKSEKPGPFRVKILSRLNNKFLHLLLKKMFFSFPAEMTGHISPLRPPCNI